MPGSVCDLRMRRRHQRPPVPQSKQRPAVRSSMAAPLQTCSAIGVRFQSPAPQTPTNAAQVEPDLHARAMRHRACARTGLRRFDYRGRRTENPCLLDILEAAREGLALGSSDRPYFHDLWSAGRVSSVSASTASSIEDQLIRQARTNSGSASRWCHTNKSSFSSTKLPGMRSTKCSRIGITEDFQSAETAGVCQSFVSWPRFEIVQDGICRDRSLLQLQRVRSQVLSCLAYCILVI
jgi:hypothetical protein